MAMLGRLAEAVVQRLSGGPVMAVCRVERPQRLVTYYFGGQRRVLLENGDGSRERCRIVGTRWRPAGRLWYLDAR
jgi:hypothetical protein